MDLSEAEKCLKGEALRKNAADSFYPLFHLSARQQRRQAKIGGVCLYGDGPALLAVQANRVYLPIAVVIGTEYDFLAVRRENRIRNASKTRRRPEQYLLLPVWVDEAGRVG